jgi:hypothetical protein
MISQQESTDLRDLESTTTVEVEVIDLGDAKVETKQLLPLAFNIDHVYGWGLLPS